MSVRLYVGNLPKEAIEKEALVAMFADDDQQISTKLIKDRKTGKCRGFAFVTVPTDEIADQFIEKYNGQSFMENPLKIEKALPRSKGKAKEEDGTENSASAGNKKKNSKRTKKASNNLNSSRQEAVQPDPRWADKLAQLKEMLAAANN